jgi:tetratricopeptide (TPR) repeat protein
MPTFLDYLHETKKAYSNKQWDRALTYLDTIEQDQTFTDKQKLEACTFRIAILSKQKRSTKSPEKKLAFQIALQEACMLQDWYLLLTSSEKIIHYQPDLSEQLFMAGERYRHENKLTEALTSYQAVLALNPHHWQAAQKCMMIFLDTQQYEALKPLCETVLSSTPRHALNHKEICFQTHYYLGVMYLAQEYLELAKAHFLRAQAISPESTEIMLKLGQISKMQMFAHHASYDLKAHRVLNEINPRLAIRSDEFATQSIRYFDAALHTSVDSLNAHEALAEIHFYKRNLVKSMQHYTHLLQKNEPNAFFYKCKMTQITIENKEYTTALRDYRNLFTSPHFSQAPSELRSELYFTSGFIYEKLENYTEAMAQYRLALLHDFRNMPACFASERLFKKLNPAGSLASGQKIPKPENALPIFCLLINNPHCPPTSKAYLIGLCGHVYAQLKNIDLALTCYQWANTLSPSGPIERAAIAQLSKLKNIKSSHEHLVQLNLFQSKEPSTEITPSLNSALHEVQANPSVIG